MKRYFSRVLEVSAIGFMIAVVLAPAVAMAFTYTITEYPTTTSNPTGVTAGPDGNVWYVALGASKAGRVTPSGAITEFTISGASNGITTGPDGNLWYTDQTNGAIGKLSPSGAVLATYPVTGATALEEIKAGPDGNLWFTDNVLSGTNRIGKITTSGTITMYSIPTTSSSTYFLAAGPDGNMWFSEPGAGKIGKVTPTGTFTEYTVPGSSPTPNGLVAGPDGNMWVTIASTNKIAKVTTSGVFTLYDVPTPSSVTQAITAGPDGNLWFVEYTGGKIGRITTAGAITEFPITGSPHPYEITNGPDGNVWFSEYAESKVGRVLLPRAPGITGHSSTVATGSSVAVDVLSGASGNPDPATLSVVSGPSHGTTAISSGTITYTPTRGYVGADSLTYRVCSLDEVNLCTQAVLGFNVTVGAPSTGFGTYTGDPLKTLATYGILATSLIGAAYATRKRNANQL